MNSISYLDAGIKISAAVLLSGLIAGSADHAFAASKNNSLPIRVDILKDRLEQPIDEVVTGSVKKGETVVTGSVLKENELLNYCFNISDAAVEARNSVLKDKLEKIETRVDKKLSKLAKRIKILKTWSKKREAFLENANDSLVQIFQTMRPDAAALQMTELGPGLASAIIAKLEPKYSSAILTEMKPTDAAKIAMVLTSAMDRDDAKTK